MLNPNFDRGMVELIPSGSTDSPSLAQDSDNITVLSIDPVQSTLNTVTRIAISSCTMPTLAVTTQNEAQDMKMDVPIPAS
jgi:hypothetical protein